MNQFFVEMPTQKPLETRVIFNERRSRKILNQPFETKRPKQYFEHLLDTIFAPSIL